MSDKNKKLEIICCKNCLMPSSRPRIRFNKKKICNACLFINNQKKTDWGLRKKELINICKMHRSRDGNYDCVVPWSGGKDSSAIAYKLKFEYGMNPLLVTFSPLIPTKTGQLNRNNLIDLGFDNLFFQANQKVSKYLSKRFFIERGNPKVHWDAGIKSLPLSIALKMNIKLIFYAENGEWHYGGNILHKDSNKKLYLDEIYENNIGDNPTNWVDECITLKDINPYVLPKQNILNKKIKPYYFAYFEKWDVENNYNFIKSKINFNLHPEGRTPGTFTNFDSLDDSVDQVYYYMQLVKFGFGRAHRDASRQIQNKINVKKKKLINNIKKFDQEIPEKDIFDYCKYISISIKEFNEIVDKHRNKEIWKFEKKKWKLRKNLFND
jgi:hypothetical protein